jgi:NADPH-dependent 2,4-dienoyl-CoA reductase/sulfur reductase-like enzyme
VLGALGSGRPAAWGRGARSDLLPRSRGRRLVVVGASFGGIAAALTVKRLVPDAEVVLLEQSPYFVFAPAALQYLFGLIPLDRIVRGYGAVEVGGLRLVHTTVTAMERDRRQLVTSEGRLDYDRLLLATGMRLAYEEVPALDERPDVNLCPYDTGASLLELRRRIGAFRGGNVVVSTPQSLYKCAPAPYEYALLWAEHIIRRRLPGKVTLVESRSRPPAMLAPGLLRALEANRTVLAYEPFTRMLRVDPVARVVETEAGRLRFDLLSVLPPNKVVPFVAEAELGEVLVDVDPRTFRCPRDERVYALGDTADTPYAKTAHTAAMSGRIAGHHVARALDDRLGDEGPHPAAPHNVCFPMVATDRALRLGADWYFEKDAAGVQRVKVAGSADNEASARNLGLRAEWQARLLGELFGG